MVRLRFYNTETKLKIHIFVGGKQRTCGNNYKMAAWNTEKELD